MSDGIFYGGQPAILDSDQSVYRYVENALPWSSCPFDFNRSQRVSQQLEAPLFRAKDQFHHESPYPNAPPPKLGELIVPTGIGRYSSALLAFSQSSLFAIAQQAWGFGVTGQPINAAQWGNAHNPLSLEYKYNGNNVSHQMYALTPHYFDDQQQLWILPLVDSRYFFRHDLRARGLELNENETWDSLLPKMVGQLGASGDLTINHSEIEAVYGFPDQAYLKTDGLSAANALDTAALSIGTRPIFENGSAITLQTPGQSALLHQLNMDLPNREIGGTVLRHTLSSTLTLAVRKLHNYFANLDEPHYVEAEITASPLENPLPLGSSEPTPTESPFPLVVWSTFWADFQSNEITSLSRNQLEALANRIAQDVHSWSRNYHITSFAGIAHWQLTGFDDYLTVRPVMTTRGMEIRTTVVGFSPNFTPRLQISQQRSPFTHNENGLIVRSLEEIPAATTRTASVAPNESPSERSRVIITPGRGRCVAMEHDRETGELVERVNSDGESVEFDAINLDTSEGGEVAEGKTLQAKQFDTLPVVDVEYCGEG